MEVSLLQSSVARIRVYNRILIFEDQEHLDQTLDQIKELEDEIEKIFTNQSTPT